MSEISLCQQDSQQAQSDIRLCKQAQEPTSREIVLCEEVVECSNPPDFTYEREGNMIRVVTGQGPLQVIDWAPCGDGKPHGEIAVGEWVSLTCGCMTAIEDACGRRTPQYAKVPSTPPPVISGPETIAVGAVYTVADGDPPYTWSAGGAEFIVSGNAIQITDVATVCSGTVTVTDNCWRSDSIGVSVGGVLTLTGTETPVVGSIYSVSGGKAPYTWSISCGTIDETGQVTNLDGCCGSGTVSVSDACGGSAMMDVRFADGQWVFLGWEETGVLHNSTDCVFSAQGSNPECSSWVSTGCSGVPDPSFISRAGTCATHQVWQSCANGNYRADVYWCKPVEEWQCL